MIRPPSDGEKTEIIMGIHQRINIILSYSYTIQKENLTKIYTAKYDDNIQNDNQKKIKEIKKK